jgi:nucleoid-associated protein YgaU
MGSIGEAAMKLISVFVALSLVAAVGLVGCGDQNKKPATPPTIGAAPGETAPYEDTSAVKGPTTPPIIATPTYGSQPVQKDVTPPPTTPKKTKTTTTKDTTSSGKTPAATVKSYKVQKGDTFSSIAKKVYGHARYAKKIYEANKDKPGVKSLDVVDEGVELKIPELKNQ